MLIRRYYALPEPVNGCNAVFLVSLDLVMGRAVTVGGVATVSPEGVVDPGTFAAATRPKQDSDEQIIDVGDFHEWFAEYDPNPADPPAQQVASGVMGYLWLQYKGLRPVPNE